MSRRKQRRKRSAGSSSPAPQPSTQQARAARQKSVREQRRRISNLPAWKLWLFRLSAAIVLPVLLFGGMELALRATGYGYSTKYFRLTEDGNWYNANADFGKTFFPSWFTDYPQPINFAFAAKKPPQTFRIFVQGASAAQGYPAPAFSFAHALEAMLRKQIPDVNFEVINTGVVAINSHVVLPIARECAEHEPDAVIVYLGNNEVVGPYGAGTVLKGFSPSMGMIRAGIWSKTTRLGQLFSSFGEQKQEAQQWGGMSMFKGNHVVADDPRLAGVYQHFEKNLTDICAVNAKSGAGVFVCTVAVNLRDSAPFASEHRPGLPPVDQTKWRSFYDAGVAAQSRSDFDSAIERFGKAMAIDPTYADLRYRLGKCYLQLEDAEAARENLVAARKYDALRFRADEEINSIIRKVSEVYQSRGVTLVDIQQAAADDSSSIHNLPGMELFYEHVHLNLAGNFLVATELYRSLLPKIKAKFPDQVTDLADSPPDFDECKRLLAFTRKAEYDLMSELAVLMQKPPFTDQLDSNEVLQSLMTDVQRLQREKSVETAADENAAFELARTDADDDLSLRYDHAVLQSRRQQWGPATENLQAVLERCPNHLMARLRLCTALNGSRRFDEAIAQAEDLIRRKPTFAGAFEKLADAYIGNGQDAMAIAKLRSSLELQPSRSRARVKLGAAMARQQDFSGGLKEIRKAMKEAPQLVDAHVAMGEVYQLQSKSDQAIEALLGAVRLNRNHLEANRRLAELFRERGDAAQASVYQEVIDEAARRQSQN